VERESTITQTARLTPLQANLDPVTGFVDRRWFEAALAQPQSLPTRDSAGLGVIAVRLAAVTQPRAEGGLSVRDGRLLIAAEVIQSVADKGDLAARIGHDQFAVLTRGDAVRLANTASGMVAKLRVTGISASAGWASSGRQGGLSAALRSAERRVRASSGSPRAREDSAARAVVAVRDAVAASALRGEATGILMQWHHCTPERAGRELAYQAHELGLSATAMARLLVVVSAGHFAGMPTVRGIELDRTVRLATYTAPSQPAWTVEPPNAANVRMASQPDTASSACDLTIAGRYQAAAGRRGSGGDWFDGFILPDGAVGLVLGDVSGHDTLAVTVMMQLRSLVRTIAGRSEIAPSEVLRRLDRRLIELGSDRLATVVFGWAKTDVAGHLVLRWCNAGHLAPVLITSDGVATVLPSADDLLLGLDGDTKRTDLTVELPPGATVLLHTDGLVETRTASIDDGLARLCAAAGPLANRAATQLRDSLLSAMVAPDSPDDVTVLAVRVPDAAAVAARRDPGIQVTGLSQFAPAIQLTIADYVD
jgi:serine phosphatase RsbU (regulator of sigma subunit)/GGDEF domain-containing protein